MIKILVLVRRYRSDQSEADEHDYIYNKKVLFFLQKKLKSISIEYDLLTNYKAYVKWKPNHIIFLGFDKKFLKIQKLFINSKSSIWAKCYSSFIEKENEQFYNNLAYIFDSCYFNIFGKKKNYYYLPTAIHEKYKNKILRRIYLSFLRKKIIAQSKDADIIFSGSPRFNRDDNYRQKLLNILIKKGIKILICAPKKLWIKSNFKIDTDYEKNLTFASHNYWATKEQYENAKFVLDLPWLDTIIPELEKDFDPQFALGWNVFRSGYYGSNLITYDCQMNRNIGLSDANCNFYRSNIENLNFLSEELEYIIKNTDSNKIQHKKNNLKNLFHKNHTYEKRWIFIIKKILNEYNNNKE